MRVRQILETCIYVDDLDAAKQFYQDVLGLEFVSRHDNRHVFLRCKDQMLLIFNPAESIADDGDLPRHGTTGPGHLAFGVPKDELDAWKSRLISIAIEIEREINWPGGGRSFYFRDPAGNSLELATPRIWGMEETDAVVKAPNEETDR